MKTTRAATENRLGAVGKTRPVWAWFYRFTRKEPVGVTTTPALAGLLSASYLGILVVLPLAALAAKASGLGFGGFWDAVTNPQALAAIKLSLLLAFIVTAVNCLFGTVIAWVLVRDEFRGKAFVNALIDLPFALPTIVAGATLLALYGTESPLGVNITFTRTGILLALLFVTLPFTVRSVQPVLIELDHSMEEAAEMLGASNFTVLRKIVLPQLYTGILTGAALGFARAIGEFGSVVLIAGNIPFKTELASVFIYGQIESDNPSGAAAVSVALLVIAVVVLALIQLLARIGRKHER